jgi:hypothetical protein
MPHGKSWQLLIKPGLYLPSIHLSVEGSFSRLGYIYSSLENPSPWYVMSLSCSWAVLLVLPEQRTDDLLFVLIVYVRRIPCWLCIDARRQDLIVVFDDFTSCLMRSFPSPFMVLFEFLVMIYL